VSPVFRHGGLRLYLLKLLDEAPRHGYDVIRLLQDKFLGVYSPSPGTIYPRLARLEEEGLVTHEVIDGKKVYKITDAGRDELNRRLDDLADLEDELSASVRDIAREITRDVRETVRNLRDEFTWAVREAGRTAHDSGPRDRPGGAGAHAEAADRAQAEADEAQARANRAQADADQAQARADQAQAEAERVQDAAERAQEAAERRQADAEAEHAEHAANDGAWSEAAAESAAGESVAGESAAGESAAGESAAGEAGQESRGRRRPSGGWREWADWAEQRDWRAWADWAEQRDWREWAGKQEWKDRAKASKQEWKEWAKASKQEWAHGAPWLREADRDLVTDLERLAAAFAREIRGVAWPAEALREDAVGNLGRILSDALNRIKDEVFRPPGSGKEES
jgi:DNA-binding PadR family transcriptional regulator